MDPRDPRTRDCGCCAGTDQQTPGRLHNAPGLPAIAYRTGQHARFKEALLARLSGTAHPALAGLGTRDDGDLTIALCDAVATTLDVLTFYQERLANEHYLRTATERRSVLEMARLIGYEPAPGVAAATWLAFTLQESPGDAAAAPAPITIPVGTRVQSVPGQDEQPQTFETVVAAAARVEWNAMAAQVSEPWRPRHGDTDLWLDGVANRLEPGDAILIVGAERGVQDPGSERWDVRVLDTVEPDPDRDRTRVAWTDPLGHVAPYIAPAAEAVEVFVFRQRAALFGHNAPDPRLFPDEVGGTGADWPDYEIDPDRLDLDAVYPRIIAGSWFALASGDEGQGSPTLPGYVELYRVERVSQISRSEFGLSARITRLVPDTDEHLTATRYGLRETMVLAQSEILTPVARPLHHPVYGDELTLGAAYEGLVPGQALAISGQRQRLAVAPGVNDLVLILDAGGSVALQEGDSLSLMADPVRLVGATPVRLDPPAFGALIGRTRDRLRLQLQDRDGRCGRLTARADELVLDAVRDSDPKVSAVVSIASGDASVTVGGERTVLSLATALPHCLARRTVRVNANVARATHGETVDEILGGGDARLADQTFALRQTPLTFVSADTPSGRASTLDLRVNDLQWTGVPSLYGQAADERVYTLEVGEETSTVRFGDGQEGSRLPSGENNVRATYRKGLGVGGNVDSGRLTNLLSRPLGVQGAINPVPATGGEDPEPLDRARQNSPLTVLTLDRAVSVKDYADFARAFAGIDKAHALWVPAGPARGVFLTVAGIAGAAVPADSDTYRNLAAALRSYGDPLVPLHLRDQRPATFRLGLAVRVADDHEDTAVLAAVSAALRRHFGFASRDFGQGVTLDEVLAAAHGVAGVVAAHVRALYRPGPGVVPGVQPRLVAELPLASLTGMPAAAELLTLAAEPLELEVLP